ncbi:MAG: hypothetical protein J5851_10905 [Oscillospiraceae bacterium]|nr:hypothetical protein [Oscillospiraceae bacterium]
MTFHISDGGAPILIGYVILLILASVMLIVSLVRTVRAHQKRSREVVLSALWGITALVLWAPILTAVTLTALGLNAK